jgi:hypothetical protein
MSAFICIPTLITFVATSLVLPADHWRYFYFVYLFGWSLPLFVAVEIVNRKNRSKW